MLPFNKSPAYKKFIAKRDQALETLLHNHQINVDNTLKAFFNQAIRHCYNAFLQTVKEQDQYRDVALIKQCESQIEMMMPGVSQEITEYIQDLRRKVFILSASSEAEAIGQALGKVTKYDIANKIPNRLRDKSPSGHDWERQIIASLMKVKNKLIGQLYWLMLNSDTDNQTALKMLVKKLPVMKDLERRKRSLKPWYMVEAKKNEKVFDFSAGFVDDEDWTDIIDDIRNENLPVDRSPDEVVGLKGSPTGETTPYYAWELEQEMTNDFVRSVRDGQIEAAKQNGITDFVVLAVIDDHTCDDCCGEFGCVDFDGKLVSEVEKMTKGKQSAPPYHFNCRCQLAPVTDDLESFTPPSNNKEFEDWLNT